MAKPRKQNGNSPRELRRRFVGVAFIAKSLH